MSQKINVNSQFVDVIKEAGFKRLLPDLDASVREVTRAVYDKGGTGELILKLKFSRANTAESGTVEMEVAGNIATKIPRARHPASLFFFNEDTESLQREDPQQPDLPGQSRIELEPAPEKPE